MFQYAEHHRRQSYSHCQCSCARTLEVVDPRMSLAFDSFFGECFFEINCFLGLVTLCISSRVLSLSAFLGLVTETFKNSETHELPDGKGRVLWQ